MARPQRVRTTDSRHDSRPPRRIGAQIGEDGAGGNIGKVFGRSRGPRNAHTTLCCCSSLPSCRCGSPLWWARGFAAATRKSRDENEDLSVILGATLTLLALIIGFSVSMASNRYDQRKSLEEAEANAIGTEMLRADLLPSEDAANVRRLLSAYLDQRILFYINRDGVRQREIDKATSQLQAELWAAVRAPGYRRTHASSRPGTLWHERRDQFAGLYTSGILEPDSPRRVVAHGSHCTVFKRAVRLSLATRQGYKNDCSRTAICRLAGLPFDSRYRCSQTWPDPRQPAEPGKFVEVARALTSCKQISAAQRPLDWRSPHPARHQLSGTKIAQPNASISPMQADNPVASQFQIRQLVQNPAIAYFNRCAWRLYSIDARPRPGA